MEASWLSLVLMPSGTALPPLQARLLLLPLASQLPSSSLCPWDTTGCPVLLCPSLCLKSPSPTCYAPHLGGWCQIFRKEEQKSSLILPLRDTLLTTVLSVWRPFSIYLETLLFRNQTVRQGLQHLFQTSCSFYVSLKRFLTPESGFPSLGWLVCFFSFFFLSWTFTLTRFLGRNQAFLFPRMVTVLGQ